MNSKIEFIEYDKLDHPIRIQFMDGSNIQYVYAADGRKLKVKHQTAVDNLTVASGRKFDQPETQQKTTRLPAVDNTIVSSDRKLDLSESQLKSQTVQYYMGNFVLTNGILDRYYFGSDGYAKFTNGKPVYSSRTKGYTYSTVNSSDVLLNPEYRVTQNVYPYYFVKDHLGSNRMVADNPSTMVSYYPYGGIYYDDFRFYQADDNHLYNGKEMDRMYGLDWLDYGARMDNPAIGLWTQMDPLAEKYYHINPYVYCAGNPIRYVDNDGRAPGDFFATMDLAALDFGMLYNDNSIREKREYGSSIFKIQRDDGRICYSYSIPAMGSTKKGGSSVVPSSAPDGYETVATIHTHGAYSFGDFDDNHFSGAKNDNGNAYSKSQLENLKDETTDIGIANKLNIDSYLATPNGTLQHYDVKKHNIFTISKSMPSDINDPTRYNNVSINEKNNVGIFKSIIQRIKFALKFL